VHTKRVGIKLYDCEHGILRSQCKQGCGGGSICEHFIQRSQCKQGCGGGSICEHFIQRSKCKQGCGGGSICEHLCVFITAVPITKLHFIQRSQVQKPEFSSLREGVAKVKVTGGAMLNTWSLGKRPLAGGTVTKQDTRHLLGDGLVPVVKLFLERCVLSERRLNLSSQKARATAPNQSVGTMGTP